VICDPSGAVKAYLYRVDAKRVSRRLVRKRFVWFGKLAEVPGDPRVTGQSGENARAAALKCIAIATRELSERGWHVDSEEARTLLRYVRFDELLADMRCRVSGQKPPDDAAVDAQ